MGQTRHNCSRIATQHTGGDAEVHRTVAVCEALEQPRAKESGGTGEKNALSACPIPEPGGEPLDMVEVLMGQPVHRIQDIRWIARRP